MSSELCPFCGKSFKRLKSHLPHCKAAKSSKTPPLRDEEAAEKTSQKTSLETKGVKDVDKPKINPTLTKKTKRKLSEQIKMAAETSKRETQTDDCVGLFPNAAEMSKSNKKEATAKVAKVNLNPAASKLSKSENHNLDESQAAPKDVNLSKKTSSKKVTLNRVKTSTKDHFLLREEETEEKLPENDAWTSKREAKITLHDVRSSLGRAKQNGRQKSNSFVDKLPPDVLKCEGVAHGEAPSQIIVASPGQKQLVPVRSETFLSELLKTERSDCVFTPRAELLKDALRVDRLTMGLALSSPARTLLEAELSTGAFRRQAPTASVLKANGETQNVLKANGETQNVLKANGETQNVLKANGEMQNVLKANGETQNVLKANGETQEATRERARGRRFTRGVQCERGLGQVTLRELPDWLMSRWPSGPRDALQMFHSGWQWYYRRYIDVRRGGVGGVAMLLAGYCVLSYVWAFPHLKRNRWRKYH